MEPGYSRLSNEAKRDMAANEGARVMGLALNLLNGEFGAARTHAIAQRLDEFPVSSDFERNVLTALKTGLQAFTSHTVSSSQANDQDELSIDERDVGAVVYSSTLELLRREVGDERTRHLADRMDELSVDGTDVFAIRDVLGLPAKGEEPGTMEDWVNFIGSAWSVIADPSSDWEWTVLSDDRSVMRVTRCPYWANMTDRVRAIQPCEGGCSTFIDTAAQKVNPMFRLRGGPESATWGKGYEKSLPKGDSCCLLDVSVVPAEAKNKENGEGDNAGE